jgi:hypothetical protein
MEVSGQAFIDVLIRLRTSEIDFASSESDTWPTSALRDSGLERDIFLTFLGDIMGTISGDGLGRLETTEGTAATAEAFRDPAGESIATSTRFLVEGVRGAGRGRGLTGENDSPFTEESFPASFEAVSARDGVKF